MAQDGSGACFAVVRFRSASFRFGAPNDETLQGHPLWGHGLQLYTPGEVENSSWIRELERINSVHPMHAAESFAALRHFVIPFHGSTFECIARVLHDSDRGHSARWPRRTARR
jgi:hypothetical protein